MSHVLDPVDASRRRRRPLPALGKLLAFLGLALGLGALAGVVWWAVVDLPAYVVQPDGGATTSERQLADFIAGDAWFTLIGAVVGLGLGILAWMRLRSLGWPVVLLGAGGAMLAALVCWFVGFHLGPSAFNPRLAAARPGASVAIQLTLRAKASLLVWPFVASIPILLGSSLMADAEEPRPPSGRSLFRRRSAPPPPTST